MFLGLVTNFIEGGAKGITESLFGIFLPFVLLILLFILRMLGAGDVKLFCAIGSIVRFRDILYVMAYSFLAGGVIAIIILLLRKNGKERFRHIATYFKYSLLTFKITPYTDFENKEDGGKFRFAYAIASGGIIYIVLECIEMIKI